MKKLFFFVLFTIIFCSSCVNTTPQDVENETYYNVKFYDGQAIISELSVVSLGELIYPAMQDKIVGSDTYRFVGWDINDDNVAESIEVLDQDLKLYSLRQGLYDIFI